MKIVKVKQMEDLLQNMYDRYGWEYGMKAREAFLEDMKPFMGQIIKLGDDNTNGDYLFHDWMYDEIGPESCCCDCNGCDSDVWVCHICGNGYDKNVEQCPNSSCNEITRKEEMLDIINEHIADGSEWWLSEYMDNITLEIRKK
jgi:hypothetical protein